MRFIKDTFITFSTQIAGVILGIAVAIIIARLLGPEGKGAYTLIILVPSMLVSVGNLGIGVSNIYFGGSKKHKWNELVSNSLVSALMLGIPLTIAFLAYYFLAHPSFLKDIAPHCIVLATLTVPLSLLTTYFSCVLLGQNRIKEYNLIQLLQAGILALFTVLALFIFNKGIFGVIVAWSAALVMVTIFSIILVRRTTQVRWGFHVLAFKESVRFGVQGYLGNVIQFLNYRLGMLLVAFFMNATFVGYYSIAVASAEALWYLPAAVGTVIVARTPGLSAEQLNRTTPQICRNTFFTTTLCALALAVLAKPIITLLFGSAFLPALEPLWFLLPGVVALSICKVLSSEITMRGKPIINTIAASVSLAINIPLDIFLIPRIGISGAALASTISYTATAIIVLVVYLRMSKNSLFETIVIKPRDLRVYTEVLKKGRSLAFGEDRKLIREALSGLNPRLWRGKLAAGQNSPNNSERSMTGHKEEDNQSEEN